MSLKASNPSRQSLPSIPWSDIDLPEVIEHFGEDGQRLFKLAQQEQESISPMQALLQKHNVS